MSGHLYTFVLSIHLTPRAQPCGAPSQKEKDRLLLVGSVICTISKPSTCPERFVWLFRNEWTCPCHCHTFLLNISCKTSFERNEAVYSSLPTGAPIFWRITLTRTTITWGPRRTPIQIPYSLFRSCHRFRFICFYPLRFAGSETLQVQAFIEKASNHAGPNHL